MQYFLFVENVISQNKTIYKSSIWQGGSVDPQSVVYLNVGVGFKYEVRIVQNIFDVNRFH